MSELLWSCLFMEHSLEISEKFIEINIAWSYIFAIAHGYLTVTLLLQFQWVT